MTDDLWAAVAAHITTADTTYLAKLEKRWRAGAKEHGDDWLSWPDYRFAKEINEERMDIVLYQAMWAYSRARRSQ